MSNKICYLTDENFFEEIENYDGVALVDFYADWCGPCKMLGPVIEELAENYDGKAKICKVNTDNAAGVAMKYKITGIPAILIFKNGKVVDNLVGYRPIDALSSALDKNL